MMRITVRSHGLELDHPTREYALRQIHQALSRFAPRLGAVAVKLGDENGPKGGEDKFCRLQIAITGRRTLVLTTKHAVLTAAIDDAAARAALAVVRELERPLAA